LHLPWSNAWQAHQLAVALAVLLLCHPLWALERTGLLPPSFQETMVPVVLADHDTAGLPAGAAAEPAEWTLPYNTQQPSARVIKLPPVAPAAERLDVWLKADGSGNRLLLEAFYAPAERWIEQALVTLDSINWQHLVIPAANPLHAFHPEVPQLRLSVVPGPAAIATAGQLVFRQPLLVRTEPVAQPLPAHRPPAPVFDTWGGPGLDQFSQATAAGVTMHLIPVDFPDGRPVAERVRYAVNAIPQAKAAGLVVGLAFYPTPPADWLKANQELLCRGPEAAYDRPGGAFLSPWHPVAEQLLCRHVTEVLQHLDQQDLLATIDLVELCPGEEGEISFEWDQVWAFDRYAIAAYRSFLSRHYGDNITAVNQDWGTAYASLNEIVPPSDYQPDREHWVFTEFYRASMLRRCVVLADAVEAVFKPKYWLWMPHSIGNARQRFFSARYPAYYTENLRRLGCADYVHAAALEWQTPEDVRQLRATGVRTIAEIDVTPTPERLAWTFQQAERFGCDGVFLGVVEGLVEGRPPVLTSSGHLARALTAEFRQQWQSDEVRLHEP